MSGHPNVSITAIVNYASLGDTESLRYLSREYKLSWLQDTAEMNYALYYACYYGHLDTVRFLIEEQDFDVNTAVPESPESRPLLAAILGGHVELVQYLLICTPIERQSYYELEAKWKNFPHYIVRFLSSSGKHIQILLCAKRYPRLRSVNCVIHVLPVELLRKVYETL